jgi:hypothetical protein
MGGKGPEKQCQVHRQVQISLFGVGAAEPATGTALSLFAIRFLGFTRHGLVWSRCMTKSQPEAAKGSPEKNQKHYTADQKHRCHEPFLMASESRVKANQQTHPAPNQSHQDAGDSRNKMGASCWWLVGWAAKQNSHEEQNSQKVHFVTIEMNTKSNLTAPKQGFALANCCKMLTGFKTKTKTHREQRCYLNSLDIAEPYVSVRCGFRSIRTVFRDIRTVVGA